LIAHDRNRSWSAICIGRAKRGTEPRVEGLGRPQADAVGVLRELVAIYDAGRREPIPLPIKTSYAWAAARHAGDDPLREAQYRWKWEDEQPAYIRAWGKNARLEDLLQPLRPGEECDGEDNRLGLQTGPQAGAKRLIVARVGGEILGTKHVADQVPRMPVAAELGVPTPGRARRRRPCRVEFTVGKRRQALFRRIVKTVYRHLKLQIYRQRLPNTANRSNYHRSPSRVSSSGRSRAAIASRALKIRDRTVPMGQFISSAISS